MSSHYESEKVQKNWPVWNQFHPYEAKSSYSQEMSKVDTVYNTFKKDPMNIRNQKTKEKGKRTIMWINLNKVDANDRFQQKWEQHETWYNIYFQNGFESSLDFDPTIFRGLRLSLPWSLFEPDQIHRERTPSIDGIWNHMWPLDGFRNVSCFLAALFPNKCFFVIS